MADQTSVGSLVFRVTDGAEEVYSCTLRSGELVVESGMRGDVVLQLTVRRNDFKAIFVQGAELEQDELDRGRGPLAFKVLIAQPERAKLIQSLEGSVGFQVSDGQEERWLVLTPGNLQPDFEAPAAVLECTMNDFMDLIVGRKNPLDLMLAGKVKMTGNAQLPLVLSGLFV
jgi:putative sterol carrier protein